MKFLSSGNVSRLLGRLRAWVEERVAEVDLRGGGTVKGNLMVDGRLEVTTEAQLSCVVNLDGPVSFGSDIEGFVGINNGLSAVWLESWDPEVWSIDAEGNASFDNLMLKDDCIVDGSMVVMSLADIYELRVGTGIPAGLADSLSLLVGEGGIWTNGPLIGAGGLETTEIEATGVDTQSLRVKGGAAIGSLNTDDITAGSLTIAGTLFGVGATGAAKLKSLTVGDGVSAAGLYANEEARSPRLYADEIYNLKGSGGPTINEATLIGPMIVSPIIEGDLTLGSLSVENLSVEILTCTGMIFDGTPEGPVIDYRSQSISTPTLWIGDARFYYDYTADCVKCTKPIVGG